MPTIGGIFTIVGFSATGKASEEHTSGYGRSDSGKLGEDVEYLRSQRHAGHTLSTTLAPIAGEFGVVAGVLAGIPARICGAERGNRLRRNESL